MSIDALTTSGINSFINSFKSRETSRRVTPLTDRRQQFERLSTGYTTLASKIDELKKSLDSIKTSDSSSVFRSKSVNSTNLNFVTASASSSAANGISDLRVNQLAAFDSVVSQTLSSSQASTATAGMQSLRIRSGDYETNFSFTISAGATNRSVMESIRDAINRDSVASVTSSTKNKNDTFTMNETNSSFSINISGVSTNVTFDSTEWAAITNYDTLFTELVTKINRDVQGVVAEKIVGTNPDDIQLRISTSNASDNLTINSTGLDGSGNIISQGNVLMTDLGIIAHKEKAASQLLSTNVFAPTTTTSKLSLTAKDSGFTNRLLISSNDSLTSIGLTSTILNSRIKLDNDNDSSTFNDDNAGFLFGRNHLTQTNLETSNSNLLNSRFEFNGINIQRDTNQISDVVSGVTLNLVSVMKPEDPRVSLSISNDQSTIKSSIEDFIEKFNDLHSFIRNNSTINSNGQRGAFVGNHNTTALSSALLTSVMGRVSGLPTNSISSLSQIGISFSPLSGLSISNSTQLDNQLNNNISQVETLFNSTSGIANVLYNRIDPFTGTNGFLTNSRESFGRNIEALNDRIESMQTRIDRSADQLRNQYQRMQMQLARLLNNQSLFSGSGF